MRDAIKLRAHHILCIQFYEGLGYDDEFNRNMKLIVDKVIGDAVLVEIIGTVDDICSECPENKGGKCTTEDSVMRKDLSALAFLGLNEGTVLTSKDLNSLARKRIAKLRDVSEVCGECSWSNVCNRHLEH